MSNIKIISNIHRVEKSLRNKDNFENKTPKSEKPEDFIIKFL